MKGSFGGESRDGIITKSFRTIMNDDHFGDRSNWPARIMRLTMPTTFNQGPALIWQNHSVNLIDKFDMCLSYHEFVRYFFSVICYFERERER